MGLSNAQLEKHVSLCMQCARMISWQRWAAAALAEQLYTAERQLPLTNATRCVAWRCRSASQSGPRCCWLVWGHSQAAALSASCNVTIEMCCVVAICDYLRLRCDCACVDMCVGPPDTVWAPARSRAVRASTEMSAFAGNECRLHWSKTFIDCSF